VRSLPRAPARLVRTGLLGSDAVSTTGRPSIVARAVAAAADLMPDRLSGEEAAHAGEVGTIEYGVGYGRSQFLHRVREGAGSLTPSLWGKDVLEIGCGHGGISCYLAAVGARSVVGIDLNHAALSAAVVLQDEISARIGRPLPVSFLEMDAAMLAFADDTLDVVFADNLFEHVMDPAGVLAEARRVLRPGGRLIVPTFCPRRTKWGPHLKQGLRLPWLGLFSDKTLIEALQIRAEADPRLYVVYPGLEGSPTALRDVRAYRDLNDLTFAGFLELSAASGFTVERFRAHGTIALRLARKGGLDLDATPLGELLSTGAGAELVATNRPQPPSGRVEAS
jgi:SAM-dependent methyltransferase